MPGWRLPKDVTTIRVSISAALSVNRANGINPAIMVSGLSNASLGISGTAAIEQMLMAIQQATKALPFALIAAVIVLIVGQSGSSATA